MTSELLQKIVLLKQKVIAAKSAPLMQKASRIEAVVDDAVFVIEDLVTKHVELEKKFNDLAGVSCA